MLPLVLLVVALEKDRKIRKKAKFLARMVSNNKVDQLQIMLAQKRKKKRKLVKKAIKTLIRQAKPKRKPKKRKLLRKRNENVCINGFIYSFVIYLTY